MNDQEIFDKVAAHLIKQGGPARDENNDCAYRAPNGRTCAVGCLIPDSAYDPDMEGRRAADPVVLDVLESLYPGADPALFSALQHVHDTTAEDPSDNWFDPLHLRSRLVSLAHNFNLSTDSLP